MPEQVPEWSSLPGAHDEPVSKASPTQRPLLATNDSNVLVLRAWGLQSGQQACLGLPLASVSLEATVVVSVWGVSGKSAPPQGPGGPPWGRRHLLLYFMEQWMPVKASEQDCAPFPPMRACFLTSCKGWNGGP